MKGAAAVDYGRKRIGVAVSDPMGITVRALPIVAGGPDPEATAARVADALADAEIARIVVGLPLHADGRESDMSAEARRFGAALEGLTGTPVTYYDEGLSSWEAEQALKERGVPLIEARRTGEIDREVARRLLQAWLRDHP